MSKYTIELRKICDIMGREVVESWFQDYELSNFLTEKEIQTIIDKGVWTKEKLASQIVDAYYLREIGFETIGMFKHYVKNTMNEIMGTQAQLLYSASLQYNPLINVDYTETYTREIKDNGQINATNNTNSSGLTINSDTPQGQINKEAILEGQFASSTQGGETSSTGNNQTTSNTTSNEGSTKHVSGNQGITASYQKMIEQYRDIIVSINNNIIKELNILFMGLY